MKKNSVLYVNRHQAISAFGTEKEFLRGDEIEHFTWRMQNGSVKEMWNAELMDISDPKENRALFMGFEDRGHITPKISVWIDLYRVTNAAV